MMSSNNAEAGRRYTIMNDALQHIAEMTNLDDEDSYGADDPQGCIETVWAIATHALAGIPEPENHEGDDDE